MIERRLPGYKKTGIGGIDEYTVLMLHGDDFTDSSLTPKTVTNNGASVVSGGKFGKCFSFDGSSYVSVPISQSLADFTVDYWCNPTSWNGNACAAVGGNYSYCIARYCTNSYVSLLNANVEWLDRYGTSPLFATGQWTHVAITRASNVVRGFVNGIKFAEGAQSTSNILTAFRVGACDDAGVSSRFWNGYVDEIRVSNIARWTSDFTPPPAQPYSE